MKEGGRLSSSSIVFLENYNYQNYQGSSFTCEYCESSIEEYELEHIIPLCLSGTNDLENLAISCSKCNRGQGGKGTLLLDDWKPELAHKIAQRNEKWKIILKEQ